MREPMPISTAAATTTNARHHGTTTPWLQRRSTQRWIRRLDADTGSEQWVELPAGMDLSFHYSDSENFDPTPGRLDVAGNPIPTPAGSPEEVGFRASFLDRKINVKVNWYETALTNAEASTPIGNPEAIGENRILNQVGDYLNTAERQFDLGNVALSDELVATAETILAIAPQSILEAESFERRGRFDVDFTDPGNQSFLADRVSDGVEIEVFGSPMEGLTMGFNASRQEVVQSNVAPRALALIEELTPKWRAIGDIPANAVDFVAAAQGNPNPNARTFNDLTDEIISLAEQTRNQEGFPLAEIREWRWNAFATYDFSGNSWWSDVTLGGALRWQDEGVIGHNSTTFTGPDGQTLFTADLSSPITVDSLLQGDLWISYDVPLLAERGVDWNIQLNIRNLLRDEDTIGVRAQPDRPEVGFIAQSRLTQPTTFVLTSTWDF